MSAAFFRRADRFPPILCRILARKKKRGAPLTDDELAYRSGLLLYDVHWLSQKTDWMGVDIYTLRSFTDACDLSFDDPAALKRAESYLNGKKRNGRRIPPNFRYLRKSPQWGTVFKPLIQRWTSSLKS